MLFMPLPLPLGSDEPLPKLCLYCGELKSIEFFRRQSGSKENRGWSRDCLMCREKGLLAQQSLLKKCSDCSETKIRGLFHVQSGKYYSKDCLACIAKKGVVHRAANFERESLRRARVYKENPAKAAASALRWRKSNPEKAAECNSRWAKNNPEKLRVAKKLWRESNPEKVKAWSKAFDSSHKEYVRAKGRAWREKYPDRTRLQKRAWAVLNRDRYLAYATALQARWSAELRDTVVRKHLGLSKAKAPQELIKAKREHIKVTRLLRSGPKV